MNPNPNEAFTDQNLSKPAQRNLRSWDEFTTRTFKRWNSASTNESSKAKGKADPIASEVLKDLGLQASAKPGLIVTTAEYISNLNNTRIVP
jgi:hypothetical protein